MAKFTLRRAEPPVATVATNTQVPKASMSTDSPASPSATPTHGTYRLRRAGLTVLTVVGLGFWLYHSNQPAPQVSSALAQSSVATTIVSDPSALIQSVLTQGEDYVAVHGTFTGFNPTEPSGVLIGAAGPGMVVSVQSGSACLYSGILPSGPRPVLSDPSLQACTPALVAQAKSTLAAEALANASDNQATLSSSAAQVESALRTWSLASGADFSKAPSSLGIAGTTVLSRTASQMVVKIASGPACEILTVPVSPNQPPTTSGC
jgi:hypothetical protein